MLKCMYVNDVSDAYVNAKIWMKEHILYLYI